MAETLMPSMATQADLGNASAISDCNTQTTRMAAINSDTLNTPYKAGLTNNTQGMCIQYGTSNYMQQLVMESGGTRLFVRRKNAGTWGAWKEFADKSAVDSNTAAIAPFTTSKTWGNFTKPTLSNGTHYGDGCNYLKIGCFVVVIISVQFDSAPSNVLLWTMPSGYIPVGNVDISASGGGSYNAKAQCVVNSSGGVRVTSVDKWVTGYGIYVVS